MYYNGKHDSTQMSLTFEKNTPEETEFCLKYSPNKNEPQSTMDLLNVLLTNKFFKEKSSFLCCEDDSLYSSWNDESLLTFDL